MANSTLVTQEDLKTFYDTYVKPYLNGESLATMHFVGSQIGTGTKNVTVDIASRKRLICITKKSGVIVESKEIPTAVLATNDVIPLGNNASVVGTTPANNPTGYAAGTDMIDKEIAVSFNNGLNGLFDPNNTNNKLSNYQTIGLEADLSSSTGASVTYTGSNSFTITVTDSTLSVYLYADMDVSGGAGVAANIAYDGSTSGSSETDVQGAIDETKSALINNYEFTVTVSVNSTQKMGNLPTGKTPDNLCIQSIMLKDSNGTDWFFAGSGDYKLDVYIKSDGIYLITTASTPSWINGRTCKVVILDIA